MELITKEIQKYTVRKGIVSRYVSVIEAIQEDFDVLKEQGELPKESSSYDNVQVEVPEKQSTELYEKALKEGLFPNKKAMDLSNYKELKNEFDKIIKQYSKKKKVDRKD